MCEDSCLFLDGEEDGYNKQSGSSGTVKPVSRFFIGDPGAVWGTGFDGAVDEFSIFTECLSSEQVKALFAAYAGSQGKKDKIPCVFLGEHGGLDRRG